MNHTRAFALELRTAAEITPAMIVRAADTIDTLLDVIEAQRGPAVTPFGLLKPGGDLRQLRDWHNYTAQGCSGVKPAAYNFHRAAVEALNAYFPKDDQL